MKNFKRIFLSLLILLFSLIFIPYISNAETHEVNNQETLVSAIEDSADTGDTIKLTDNIELTSPVSITGKTLTIDGDGHSISKASEGWQPEGPNGSLLTAGGKGTKLTLTNITLKNAQKYGVQSYNGAHVVLNDVTITNNGFGGVLANAGTVEIIKLHLGQNGQYDNNGIEIGKGDATGDEVPELIMNGTLTSEKDTNVIYIATNNDKLTNFEVKNTENTVDKILVSGNKVVITDENNNILFESNENNNLAFAGETFVEKPKTPSTTPENTKPENDKPETTQPETTPNTQTSENNQTPQYQATKSATKSSTNAKDPTPKTGSSNTLAISILIFSVSVIATIILNKKDF